MDDPKQICVRCKEPLSAHDEAMRSTYLRSWGPLHRVRRETILICPTAQFLAEPVESVVP